MTNVASERVARMIAYLVEHQRELADLDKGQINFHFAGRAGLTVETVSKTDLNQT